jgi:site-specific recombinase XerD
MAEAEVEQFLNHLAVERKVSASTQNQALCALVFLYREVLGKEIGWMDNLQRAHKPERLPVVLTQTEVRHLLAHLEGRHELPREIPPTGSWWLVQILSTNEN